MNMRTFEEFIKNIRMGGRGHFITEQALSELGVSRNAFHIGMHRLKKKGDIVSPAKDLYIIVPPEDQIVGCIPAEQLMPILMQHWGADYYACLLTAAMYNGASHQKPQVFQVMSNRCIKPLVCGRLRIDFIYKKSMAELPTQDLVVKTGYLKISSPELTAIDLLAYPSRSGGLNNIATVLSELIETMNPDKLIEVAKMIPRTAWVQRLGYILEAIGVIDESRRDLVLKSLEEYLSRQRLYYVPLLRGLPIKGCQRNNKWMIIENTAIESDYDT